MGGLSSLSPGLGGWGIKAGMGKCWKASAEQWRVEGDETGSFQVSI